jgi:hypothetical protein
VARYLGSSFTSGIGSGLESITFREGWLSSGNEEFKNRLLAYNREDCEALHRLCDFIRHSVVFAETKDTVPGRQEKVALSESLRRTGEGNRPKFKKAEFMLPEFARINRCAYFDYQSEKVYASVKRKVANTSRRPELLTLVSVLQTCEYSGINPLDFLLSGETSLAAGAKPRSMRARCRPTR